MRVAITQAEMSELPPELQMVLPFWYGCFSEVFLIRLSSSSFTFVF